MTVYIEARVYSKVGKYNHDVCYSSKIIYAVECSGV